MKIDFLGKMEVEVLDATPDVFVCSPLFFGVKLGDSGFWKVILFRIPMVVSTLGGVGRGRVDELSDSGSRSAVIQPRIILPSSVMEKTQCSEAKSRKSCVESG